MYIKKIIIQNSMTDEIIRTVVFRRGVNFIVDESTSHQHNKVGKTTFLRLIDVALGAKDRKNIYFDSETGATELNVEKFINDNYLVVKLLVSKQNNILLKEENYTLEVGLYKKGRHSINGESLNKKDYLNKLNELFFDNTSKPTFRQLIKSFVRISMNGDNSSFLKNIPPSSYSVYRMVYDYLFDIGNQAIEQERDVLLKELKSLKNDKKRFEQVQNVNDVGALKQVIEALQTERDSINDKLNDIVSTEYFLENREKIDAVRKSYTELNQQIAQLNYQQELNKKALDKLDVESHQADKSLVSNFFDEINRLIPNINKTFDDLVLFNKKLIENKREYLKHALRKNIDLLSELENKQKLLIDTNKNFIALIQNNRIDDYKDLMEQLSLRDKEISDREAMKAALVNYDNSIDDITNKINHLNKKFVDQVDDPSTQIRIFNKYFLDYAQKINGERPVLTYLTNPKEFPLQIRDIDGTSTGTRKSLIAAYDIAYQSFAAEQNKQIPNFVIHDVMENIESENLSNIVKLSESTNTQYIAAILEENLKLALPDIEEREQLEILRLSTSDKLFKI